LNSGPQILAPKKLEEFLYRTVLTSPIDNDYFALSQSKRLTDGQIYRQLELTCNIVRCALTKPPKL